MENYVDLSEGIEIEDIQLCPLCDNPIDDWDNAALFFAHGFKQLGHTFCIVDLRDELDK